MFDTKIAIVLRDDLAPWQALNVTAFLSGGLVGETTDLIGAAYVDKSNNRYNGLIRQPIMILTCDAATIAKVHRRILTRELTSSIYIEEMFKTGHDEANRAVFNEFDPQNANVVGIGVYAERKLVDKVTKGAKMHP